MGVNFYNRDLRDLKFILFEYLDIDKIIHFDRMVPYPITRVLPIKPNPS